MGPQATGFLALVNICFKVLYLLVASTTPLLARWLHHRAFVFKCQRLVMAPSFSRWTLSTDNFSSLLITLADPLLTPDFHFHFTPQRLAFV